MNIHELNTKAITNPAYVALDDGSDTYKLDLNAKLSTMQNSISGAESDIVTAQGDITLLQTNMSQAQGAIFSAQGEIEDLQSNLNALSTQTSASIGNLQTELDAAEDDVTDLKEAISDVYQHSLSDTVSATGNVWKEYNIRAGQTYVYKNTSESSGQVVHTTNAVDYNYVEQIGTGVIYAGQSIYFTATQNAKYVNVYSAGAGSFEIYVGSSLAQLDKDIDILADVDTTLYDGYINTMGEPVAPTADADKYSDFVFAPVGSKIDITVNFNPAKYRKIYIVLYDENKAFVKTAKVIEGGTFSTINIAYEITEQNVAFFRFGFNGYNSYTDYTVTVDRSVDRTIKNVIAPIESDISFLWDADYIKKQYLSASAFTLGYYGWNRTNTDVQRNNATANWYATSLENLPAGTYYYNKFFHPSFSFIKYLTSGTVKLLGNAGFTETTYGRFTSDEPFSLYITIHDQLQDKTTAMFCNGFLPKDYVTGDYKDKVSEALYTNANGQTVWTVGADYIPSIQKACDFASANDIIFIRCGTYTEQVSIWNKKLHLVGEDKATTILIDHSGAYSTPPLEMSLGSLSNMTIIEDGANPTLQPSDAGYNMAYCLHIEWAPPANEVFYINNCDFIDEIHAPLGCGLYQDYTVHFKDCTFRCGATNEGNNERGSFYFHSNVQPNITGQKIIAENCIISSAGTKWAVLLGVPNGANNSGECEARFSNCCIWNDNLGTVDSIAFFDRTGGADVLRVVNSYGNTVAVLNN